MNTSQNFRPLLAVAAAFATSALSFTAAHADQSVDAPQITVKYADLAVNRPEGAATLYRRIWAASLSVCRPLDDGSFAGKHAMDSCIHRAIADAVSKVNQPALSLVYRAKNPELASPVLTAGIR
jgi:UrcA family protein